MLLSVLTLNVYKIKVWSFFTPLTVDQLYDSWLNF